MFNEFMSGDPDFWREPDFLLVDLVSGFVNKGGMELGITLFIKGLVVTGTLTSEQEYLKAISGMFATQAKKSLVNPTKQEIKNTEEVFDFTGLAEDVDLTELYGQRDDEFEDEPEPEKEPEEKLKDFEPEDDERGTPAIRHLHLKDPVIIQPQPAVSFMHSQVSVLRIKLTSIDGWMVGKVTVDDDMTDFPPPDPHEIRH
ncbi:MAG: hypothetical protein J0L63_08825 [Anaerolineae bacterium]|nr:hypothetical protein [Anaerolineae bacterium]MBN8618997.1 hypothetical protein [Anaerolineae bacterium]